MTLNASFDTFERTFFQIFIVLLLIEINAEFRKDFRHSDNSSITSKLPSLPKFKNIFFKGFFCHGHNDEKIIL